VLANPHTWPPFIAFFFMYAAVGNMMLWFIPYLRDVYGMVTTEAALYATASSLALLGAGPLTGWLSDRVLARRKLPYLSLAVASLGTWLVFLATLGSLPPSPLYALLFVMGAVSGGFVLTWPIAREVNPPELAGVAVAVANLGGFLGAAVTQGPLGAVLDARWTGAITQGARAYPVEAYRAAFSICAAFVLLSAVAALFVRETRGRNVYHGGPRHGPPTPPALAGPGVNPDPARASGAAPRHGRPTEVEAPTWPPRPSRSGAPRVPRRASRQPDSFVGTPP
jgi:MFS family permease